MIVTHTHSEEQVPMFNCWEGEVFARVGDHAWSCISEQRYDEMEAQENQAWINTSLIAVVITACIFWLIYLQAKREEKKEAEQYRTYSSRQHQWWYCCVAPKDYTKWQWWCM